MFQFLIGTIKSIAVKSNTIIGLTVSIPYRYDKILPLYINLNQESTVSIPYRYDKITPPIRSLLKAMMSFNSL